MSLKLISLNMEGSKHLARIVPFVSDAKPDVLCLQELNEADAPMLRSMLNMESYFVPMTLKEGGPMGLGIFSRNPLLHSSTLRYGGSQEEVPSFDATSIESMHASKRFSLAIGEIEKDGAVFRICTTHFPLTHKGEATDFQRKDMQELLTTLHYLGDFVLCGDFNAPRGGEIFSMLAKTYTDHIPLQYKTSLDMDLHRAGKNNPEELADKMVDGLFSTPHYRVGQVSLASGVSDHCAVVASIRKLQA